MVDVLKSEESSERKLWKDSKTDKCVAQGFGADLLTKRFPEILILFPFWEHEFDHKGSGHQNVKVV